MKPLKPSVFTLLLSLVAAGISFGQTIHTQPEARPNNRTVILIQKENNPPAATPAPVVPVQPGGPVMIPPPSSPLLIPGMMPGCGPAPCDAGCGKHGRRCHVPCLVPWTCDSLIMEPFQPNPCACGWKSFLWCPPEPIELANGNGNGNGEKTEPGKGNGKGNPNGNGNGENPDEPGKANGNGNGNGNGEEEAEEEETLFPLMAWMQCQFPGMYNHMNHRGTSVYGWVQAGFTGNFASPRDRLNYGVNFNNRSNDVLLNQAYIALSKPINLDERKHQYQIGYQADFFYGHDAPYWENANGVFPNFLGDRGEVSRLTEMGIALPQAYFEVHTPWLTDRGMDWRVGRFYTLMGNEVFPAPDHPFYSHNYEHFFAVPFTHVGVLNITHLGDTMSLYNGIVRGWDVALSDNNDAPSYIGALTWDSCDGRNSFALAWVTGPEQDDNSRDFTTVITAYYTRVFGAFNEWTFITGGNVGWEQNGTADELSPARTAEWYGYSVYLFYTVNPKLTLGFRGEWWRDDDGARTGFENSDRGGARWNRPGYSGNFWDVTFGVTWRPAQNLFIRPEIRFDWFDGQAIDGSASRPFNDQRDNFQATFGCDMIWQF